MGHDFDNQKDSRHSCARPASAKEIAREEARFDALESALLDIARLYWQTFAAPGSQSWIRALKQAQQQFGPSRGGEVGLMILAVVQAMRTSRSSCFRFNNPDCRFCAAIVSEHERQFMNVFRAVRGGHIGPARTHAMILCEGNNTDAFIASMTVFAKETYFETSAYRPSSVAAPIH